MTERLEQPEQLRSPDEHSKTLDNGPAHSHRKSDGNTAFLRAARSGNLDKVLEFINANVDINTSNSNGLNALHLASKDGHTEVVAELLKRGAHVDAATKKGNTALHIASLAGQEEVVKLLIEHGALVNVQSQSGFTPLYMAAQENHEKVVRYLLNHGANQSLATEDGFTPLAVAMQQGHDKVVTELLENDTRGKIRLPALHIAAKKDDCKAAALLLQSEHNPDITSKSGFTPLHIASHYGNDAIASLLLAKGADVNYAAKHNITPLHVAAKWGRNNMVVLLLDKGASIMAKTRDGLTPLHCAARSGHEQVVDTLLQRHAPITAKTKNGLAPLHMASQGDHVEAARVLLTHRAPVDDVTVDYLTALHVASHCGHVSVAKLLLDRKADPNARALNGFTPLHIACKKNRVKIVELLLKQGASIEATTESGLSPLHVASFMGCMNIVIYLLQCEANPDVSTIRGETPLHLASRANQTDIIRILLRNGAQVDAKAREQQTPLHIASRLGNTDIVMLLLQHGANVDSVTKDLYTSMHIAAKEDQEEVIQTLLENEASMTAATKKGFTPLHLAAKYGRTKIATLLLQRGAPVDAQGKNGVTPLHVASHYDHQGIALLLLDKGASPHATAKNGHTPLHIAAKKNQMDIAAMLLEYGARADVESKAGFTPLHLAAQEGHVDMTNLLLEHKCDVNYSSKNGLTPLHLCAQEDCVEVAKILVRNGADANTVTKAGYTPLHIASHFGQLNMVRFLLSQKVKVDAATSTGYTPLHQAAQQGNSAIVAVLLDNGASPNSKNNQGLTALYIAQKLGYISVVEVLKNVTKPDKGKNAAPGSNDDKYKVVAPETMQENFMSDSEDEGGDDATNEQSYRYLTIDEMKSLGDDSMPLDVSKEDRYDTTAGVEESITPQHNYNNQFSAVTVPDNVDVTRTPVVQTGFLVSFLVDAKGGAMRGCRHSGVRVIVPPQCVTMPTRVTCRYVRRDKPNPPPPPPLMEGEALASRILELGPVGVKFLGPVVIEVPNFAALRGNEREIVILRSDNGETWREHTVDSSTEAVRDILSRSFDKDGNQLQTDEPNRITSIVTTHFPHYFAVVSRIRQEVHAIGPEGGMVSSSVVPQVQAVFPPGALTKKIKVGLQAQPIPSELTAAVLGNCVAVSPIVTIEPRRRKFHKKITLTLPVPQAANKGMINQYSGDAPTLRLLCSITGGTSRAQWEDVTGTSPLTFVKECVSFTTNVSARFWLMDIRDVTMATKKATELYREAILTPFMVKFVVFAKRIDNDEARLRVFCMTDDKEDKTLECQEHFTEVAKSRDVEVLEGKKQLVELSGNLISVTKAGDQLKLGFNPFHENRLPFTVRIKDSLADPIGRMLFFKEQKPVKTSTPHPPICVLNIVLPDGIIPDPEYLDSPLRKYSFLNDSQSYHKSELPLVDVSNMIDEDWVLLAEKLGISSTDVNAITFDCQDSVSKQALTMLQLWHRHANNKSSLNILENALLSIGRQDIVQECILNASESKRRQNGDGIYTNGISNNMIENYHSGKRDLATTDDDEKKYTGEEKAIDEPEIKKSVCERKMEIEKRLQHEKSQRSSVERSDSNEKRRSLEHETVNVVRRQNSQNQDVTRTDLHDENDSVEPTSLTFEQKRLSFERGYSVDKVVSEGDVCKIKPEETIKTDNDEKAKPEEKRLSFAEKRLSFEQSSIPSEKKEVPTSQPQRSAEDKRRDSELLEGVSVGLGKFDVERSVIDQSCLSLKPSSTPPPSPAEFKKQDSVDSDKSSKHVSKQVTAEDVVTSPEVGAKSEKPASDNDAVQRLTERKRPRVRGEQITLAPARCHYKRANSAQDALTINDVSTLAMIPRTTNEQINVTSFKKHFAASCLPSCVWNQSLPNLHFSSSYASTDCRRTAIGVPDSTLLPASSVEYFTPEENFVPQVGAYCTWSSSLDGQLTEDLTNSHLVEPVNIDAEECLVVSKVLRENYSEPLSCCDKDENNKLILTSSPIIYESEKVPDFPAKSEKVFEVPAEDYVKSSSVQLHEVSALDDPIFVVGIDDREVHQPSSSPVISIPQTEFIVDVAPLNEVSLHTAHINTESVCEIPLDDENLLCEEAVSLETTVEPLQIVCDDPNEFSDAPAAKVYADENEKFAELMNKVFERNLELEAAGQLEIESNAVGVDENLNTKKDTKDFLQLVNGEFNESDTDNTNIPNEMDEKLHKRKVAFRLNSTDDGLVYPGQTDSEEYTSSESVESNVDDEEEEVEEEEAEEEEEEEEDDAGVEDEDAEEAESAKEEIVNIIREIVPESTKEFTEQNTEIVVENKNESTSLPSDIERKFERIASLEECSPHTEGEFHRMVSQLSVEEMDDCLNAWDATHEKANTSEGDIQQHSYSDSNTSLNCTRVVETEVSKQDSMDYNSKKKFWQSFETSSVSESKPAPVPKPRASICTTSVRDEKPPLISKRSAENVMKPSNTRREKVHKSESEDNVLFAAANAGSKSTIRQMHSVTAYSTDSEAEYIAACGVEKLAYENVAFSEEEEDRSLDVSQSSEGGVKAKKMFFESQQKEISTSREDSFTHPPPSKTDSRSSTVEEHIDKSELESTEKKKTSLVEETDDLSAATPNDINSTNGYSAGDNADSTQSESDITPEDLKDKQDSLPGSESISHGSHQRTDSDHSTIGQLEIDTEINKVKEEIRVSKRDPETKLDDKVITKDSLVDKVVPEEKITKDVVVEVSSNKPLEDVVTRKASVESSSETVTAEVTKNETPAVVSNSSTTADKCPVKTKETISTSDAVDTSPPHESKIERVEGLETPTSPVQRPFDENVDRKPNSESKIPLFKRSSTAENLKTGSKSLKSDGSIESQASVKSSSIMDKSTDDQSESDNSSYSDLKSTPTRIPVAKSPPSTSQSEEKEDKKGTPTKIPMAKGPLTTSQSEIIRKSSEEKEQKSTPTKIPMAKSSPSNSQCESLQKTSSMVDDQNITPTRIPIAKGPLNTSSSEIIRKEEKNQKGSPTKIPIAKSPLNTSQTEIILQKSAKTSLTETKSGSVESKILPASQEKTAEQILDSGSSFESVQTSTSEVNVSVTSQSSIRSDSKDEDFSSEGEKPARTSSAKVSFDESKLAEDLKDSRFSQPDVETEFLDQQGFTYCIGDKRTSITEDEAKVAAEGLIIDIESELNKRPDIVENLLLMRHADYIRSMSVDPVDDVSNDITDEDLRSTGTETDIADCHDFYDREELQTDNVMKISEASPTEYKIDYELAEEFNVLQSVDFEEQLIAEVAHATTSQNKTFKAPRSTQLPTPNVRQSSDERKSGEESGLRIDLMSPESISSSGTPRKSEDVTSGTSGSRSKKSGDGEFCSSSSESHYQSLTLDNRTALGSRPCSSDVEVLLSCAAGSSDYETAVSHDTTSYPSHDFHTAVSSASIHESLKSIDSESSGHLGSAEVSSEISETLVASSSELEHDIDIASSSRTYDDKGRGLYRRSPLEPYDQDIPVNIIRNVGKMSTKSAESDSIAQPVPAEVHLIADSKLVSSCEDTSSVSTTDGANLPTAFEIASNDSDRMDNSLTSEQSLTMSAISNQLSTSSSDFREEIDNDRKMIDMSTSFGTSQGVSQTPPTSVTLFTSTNEHQEKQNVCTQVTSSTEGRRRPSNEALPESLECKDETPPKTTAILTQVKYFTSAGTPEDGSGTFESVTFEQEKQAPEEEMFEHEVQDGKKWMELQFQAADAEGTIAYEYAYERAPLEDIKEEDTDDMQSSKMGSVGSQISQSIPSVGSAGSMKQSLSSTPDYDIMAAKRGQGKAPDPDSVSQASLQEFERLEQMMSLESMKGKLSSSQDSIASSDGSGGKKRSSDNISVTSLKEFEGLEHACMEVEKIEERAKAEERSLSQIEEGHESQASESESCETLEKSVYDSDEDASNYDQKMFDIDEIIRQAQTNVEKFVDPDRLERTESLGRGDSFEETSRIPDLELDQPLADANHSSSEVYSGKKYIENVDISHSLTVSTDSLELKQAKDTLLISTDSLEGKVKPDVASDSLEDEYRGNTISDRSCVSEKGSDIPHDELDNQPCHLSPNPISSPDSVDAFTSSTATHATYHNEGDSVMSSSFTSGGSNTMISSTENLENVVSNYSNWLEGGQHYVSETVETISEDKSYSTVQRTVEGTEGAKVVYRGPDAKAMLERDLESFRPGEFYSETREVDADGNVCVKRVIETRSVLSSEQVKNSQTITLENRTTSDFSSELLSHVQQQQSGKVRTGSSDKNEQPHSSVETKDEKTKNEKKEQK